MPIEKGIIYIKLAKVPFTMECNAKNHTNSDGIYHKAESLVKVNTKLLVEAFRNKSSFILCSIAIRIFFDAKHPFVAHYILPQARGNKSIIFFLHSLNPLWILESSSNSTRFRERGNYGGVSYLGLGLVMEFLEWVCMG